MTETMYVTALLGILQRHRDEFANRLARAEARVVVLEAEKADLEVRLKDSGKSKKGKKGRGE